MDITAIVPWLSAAALLISIGTAFGTLIKAGSKENEGRIKALESASEATKSRLQTVEGELRHLPDKDVVHRLELTLSDMRAEMNKIAASADQSARTSQRVETYLMERAKP